METSAYDYNLPDASIAQVPIAPRHNARLLVDRGAQAPEHRIMRDLPELLSAGDLLVVNTTRVLPARLALQKTTGGQAEVLLLHPLGDGSLYAAGSSQWMALVRPGRRLAPGTKLFVPGLSEQQFFVEVGESTEDGQRVVSLFADQPLLDALEVIGQMPLPPYITEKLDDAERYQTVYAERPGSAAAPTAGLHFTDELLADLTQKGIRRADVELVVGLGTFKPISADHIEDHVMHTERYSVPAETKVAIEETKAQGGKVIAVGTTTVRALESMAAFGRSEGETNLYIHGDYNFAIVDRLITNFHLPKSSLLVMIESFAGPRWRDLYQEALENNYRFLSFGDAMLLTSRREVEA
ncbi:MAG: S-adenosylmethionine:tRNA ribosyltransferase-isomerase [Actinomycetota bacterium]